MRKPSIQGLERPFPGETKLDIKSTDSMYLVLLCVFSLENFLLDTIGLKEQREISYVRYYSLDDIGHFSINQMRRNQRQEKMLEQQKSLHFSLTCSAISL